MKIYEFSVKTGEIPRIFWNFTFCAFWPGLCKMELKSGPGGSKIDPRRLQNRPWRLQNRLPEAPKSTPEAPVGTSWAIVGHLGAILDHLGVNLGSFWAHLGSSWGHFEWNSELFLNKCCCVWSSRSFFLRKGRTSKFANPYSTFEGFSCYFLCNSW